MFEISIRVYYEDTDAGGVVYYANYLKFIERARSDYLRQLGLGQQRLKDKDNILFVVKSLQANYRLPAKLDQHLCVQTQVEKRGKTRAFFHQKILDKKENKVLFDASVEVVCVVANTFKVATIPIHISEKLT